MDWWLVLAILLYLAAAALLIAEVFVPSGGIISICSLACLIGGLLLFFRESALLGWIGIGVAFVMIPVCLIIAYKLFPHTKFGRSVTLIPSDRGRGEGIPDQIRLKELEGQNGTVLTALRPVGTCDFSGRRVECVAESGYIDKGTEVRVIRVEGSVVTVRKV